MLKAKIKLNGLRKKKYLFKLPEHIKIISEPNIINTNSQIYIFYEFKKNTTNWNISYKSIKLEKIFK